MKEWLTVEEAAALARRTKWAIYKWAQRGKITSYEAPDGTLVFHSGDVTAVERDTPRKGGRPIGSAAHNRPRQRA